jgi:glycosyltransferase involved in cell wall biosynthesis
LHGLAVGGAEVLAARLARQLQESYRFVFACLDEQGSLGEELEKQGFRVEVLGRRQGVDCQCAWRLARFLRQERVDLVHAHQYTPFFYAAAARWLYRRPPVIFTEHGRHYPDYPRRKRILLNRFLLERRDRVVGVGQAVRSALIANEGLPADRVEVIWNGVDLAPFANGLCRRQAVRKEIGVEGACLVLLLVARFDYLKDHATAVRTLGRVVHQLPGAQLVLIGDGPGRRAIEESIREQNVADHVRLLGARTDVARLMPAADIFLLTSISEGIPLTVIEAMAAGLPVVATRAGGVPEVVDDGCSGLLAPVGDDAALAEHVIRLASDPQVRQQMGEHGRRRARELFAEEKMHASYLRLYRDTIADRQGRAQAG